MHTLWFITNTASRTATHARCEALQAVFHERGLELAGRTDFPDDELPHAAALDGLGVDTVVLFAGDGTINAALCALASWDGAFLILPGGTMNLLARALHGTSDSAAIVHAAHMRERRTALPLLEAGRHRAFVAIILGPAASWYRAREMARRSRPRRLLQAARYAWRASFSGGVRVTGAPGLHRSYQAVLVQPRRGEPRRGDLGPGELGPGELGPGELGPGELGPGEPPGSPPAGLDVTAVDARDWRRIASLGWDWLTGDWMESRAVTRTGGDRLTIRGRRPVLALFDGEPRMLEPGTTITTGLSRESLIATAGGSDD